jgi:hypothetical protein
MHKESFIINCNTLLHVSTLLGHLQGELFVIPTEFTPPKTTQYTVNSTSHSTITCNLSVTITKSSPWRWPSRVETCRSVLQLMIKLSLCICWRLVFFIVEDVLASQGLFWVCSMEVVWGISGRLPQFGTGRIWRGNCWGGPTSFLTWSFHLLGNNLCAHPIFTVNPSAIN